MARTALVVGASGIVGSAAAALLSEQGWTVHGLVRRPGEQTGVRPVAADLQDAAAMEAALASIDPQAVFITTGTRQASKAAKRLLMAAKSVSSIGWLTADLVI